MATPFSAVSRWSKDAYDFYHSQLVRTIRRPERAFGMLSHRWAILRSAFPMQITQNNCSGVCAHKAPQLLYWWKDAGAVAPLWVVDEVQTAMQGGIPLKWIMIPPSSSVHWSCFPTASNTPKWLDGSWGLIWIAALWMLAWLHCSPS